MQFEWPAARNTEEFDMHRSISHSWIAIKLITLSLLAMLVLDQQCQSASLPRDAARTINIQDFSSKTYLQTMQSPGNGIFDKTDADDKTSVTIATADQIVAVIGTSGTPGMLDPSIATKVYGFFVNGEQGFHSLIAGIQSQALSPNDKLAIPDTFLKDPQHEKNFAVDTCTTVVLLASGSGTLVEINANDYFYNVGYKNPDVRSGRSFGSAPSRLILDPSDVHYLTEMDNYLKSATTGDIELFYQALSSFLTKSDGSQIGTLTSDAQVVATDLLAIYTAELDRHIMSNLDVNKHPWEIDVAEVTFLTSYGAASGMVMKNGSLQQGTAADYYAKSTSGSGSGIGETRNDFMKLAEKITTFEKDPQHHPDLVQKIIDLTPIQDPTILAAIDGDVFRRFLVFLNRTEFESQVTSSADALALAMNTLLLQIRADQADITTFIQNSP
jgi:hypothetical protein